MLTEAQDPSAPLRAEGFNVEEAATYHFSMYTCTDDESKLTGTTLHTYIIIKIFYFKKL